MFVWTISDLLTVIVLCIVVVACLAASVPTWIKQALCKHQGGVRETLACDAICCDCGKNLGFIGTVRAKRAAQAKGAGHE